MDLNEWIEIGIRSGAVVRPEIEEKTFEEIYKQWFLMKINVIKAQKLFETAVAVVRYFGGIKLGAGGLTRAYSSAAAETVALAKICEYAVCVPLDIRAEYAETNALLKFLTAKNANVLLREFDSGVHFRVAVREREADRFCAELNDCVNGRAKITSGEGYYFPFPIE